MFLRMWLSEFLVRHNLRNKRPRSLEKSRVIPNSNLFITCKFITTSNLFIILEFYKLLESELHGFELHFSISYLQFEWNNYVHGSFKREKERREGETSRSINSDVKNRTPPLPFVCVGGGNTHTHTNTRKHSNSAYQWQLQVAHK